MTRLPLFPLNAVLFPNTPLPLHIFEERYRLLVARCIAEKLPFGVVYHRGEKMEHIGCSAQVDRVLKRYDDGRLDIVTIGQRRFSIEAVDTSRPYLQALVHFLSESEEDEESADTGLATAAIDAMLRYIYYAEKEIDRDALRELTVTELSFLIAGIDEMGLETKQHLLEVDNPVSRLEESVEALEQVTQQLVSLMSLRKATGNDVDMGSMKN
ncbi:MAG: LON peptidase substrate-binding domain-containing protein [Spirochaetales bacterium]|nr:LON peptidase substrate-binding domain-containing protein [Spirochaetales bacterium]